MRVQVLPDSYKFFVILTIFIVGALTSKPYAFSARSWELYDTEIIENIFDVSGPKLEIQIRDNEILRVLPRVSHSNNIDWISDRARYFYDGLFRQRLVDSYFNNRLETAENGWNKFFANDFDSVGYFIRSSIFGLSQLMFSNQLLVMYGTSLSIEQFFSISRLARLFNLTFLNETQVFDDFREFYSFGSEFNWSDMSDSLVVSIGTNIKIEFPVLYSLFKLPKYVNTNFFSIGGTQSNELFINLSNNTSFLLNILFGKSKFCKNLVRAEKVYFIYNIDSISEIFLNLVKLTFNLRNLNVNLILIPLTANNNISTFELAYSANKNTGLSNCVYFSALYGFYLSNIAPTNNTGVVGIYQNSHADRNVLMFDLIQPSSAIFESRDNFYNSSGIRYKIDAKFRSPDAYYRMQLSAINDSKVYFYDDVITGYIETTFYKWIGKFKYSVTQFPFISTNGIVLPSKLLTRNILINNRVELCNKCYSLSFRSYAWNSYFSSSITRVSKFLNLAAMRRWALKSSYK